MLEILEYSGEWNDLCWPRNDPKSTLKFKIQDGIGLKWLKSNENDKIMIITKFFVRVNISSYKLNITVPSVALSTGWQFKEKVHSRKMFQSGPKGLSLGKIALSSLNQFYSKRDFLTQGYSES